MFIQFCSLDSVFPKPLALKGFPFLDLRKQELPVGVFSPQQSTPLPLYSKFGFSGFLKADFLLLAYVGPSAPYCAAAARELLSFSIHVLAGRTLCLRASIPGWYPCLPDKAPTHWSNPKGGSTWNKWTPWYLEGQVVLDSKKMLFSFGWNSFFFFFFVTAFDRFSAGDLAGCSLSC